jgi:hypothetical protein
MRLAVVAYSSSDNPVGACGALAGGENSNDSLARFAQDAKAQRWNQLYGVPSERGDCGGFEFPGLHPGLVCVSPLGEGWPSTPEYAGKKLKRQGRLHVPTF